MKDEKFHDVLMKKADEFAHLIYKITRSFPSEEKYGITSQIRRVAISVVLNYIEGYARQKNKVHRNFIEISYGSLQEAKYLLLFSLKETFITDNDYKSAHGLAEEIGAMLWGMLKRMKEQD